MKGVFMAKGTGTIPKKSVEKMCTEYNLNTQILLAPTLDAKLDIIMDTAKRLKKPLNEKIALDYIKDLIEKNPNIAPPIPPIPPINPPDTPANTPDPPANPPDAPADTSDPPANSPDTPVNLPNTSTGTSHRDGGTKENKDTLSAETTIEKDAGYIGKLQAQQYEELSNKQLEDKKIISELNERIATLENIISKIRNDKTTIIEDKYNISIVIKDLNDLLNSKHEKVTVEINRELLSKVTKFVDSNSLIRLESVIREGHDLTSTIVQSILLAFMHEHSLQ
jgi:hypothetical protein